MLDPRMTPEAITAALKKALLVVPLSVVLAAAAGWFLARTPQASVGARVYGQGVGDRVALRAVVVEQRGSRQLPWVGSIALELRAEASQASPSLRSVVETNSDGVGEFNAELPAPLQSGPLQVRVVAVGDGEPLAEVALAPAAACNADSEAGCAVRSVEPRKATSPVSRRGGAVRGHGQGQLQLEVGVVRGVLAVPFAGEVIVHVTNDGSPVAGAKVWARVSGGRVATQQPLTSDDNGRLRFLLWPTDHVVELTLAALTPEGANNQRAESILQDTDVLAGSGAGAVGRWYGVLPLVPGAASATLDGGRVRVESPVPRSHLYVDLLESGVLRACFSVELSDPALAASVPLPTWVEPTETVAVVSSEPDMQAMAIVGWPLATDRVRQTYDYRTPLLVDGVRQARERGAARSARMGRAFLAIGVVASVLELVLFAALQLRLPSAGAALAKGVLTPERSMGWVFALCLLVGLLALASFGLW